MRRTALILSIAGAMLAGAATASTPSSHPQEGSPPSLPPLPQSPPMTPAPPAAPASPAAPPSTPPAPFVMPPAPAATTPIGERRSIAVIPFEATLPNYVFGTGPSSPDGECGTTQRPGSEVARRCTQELIERMVGSQRFRVVDRDTVDRVLAEQGFHRAQGMAPGELTRLGRLIGADRLVVSSVDLAGTSCRRVEVRASGYLRFEFGGGIEIAYRVLDVASGEIVSIGRLTNTWDTRSSPELRGVLSQPEAALAFFARQMAMRQTVAVLDAIDPVRVAALQDGTVILNQGIGRGLAPGMALRVMRKIEPIRDPETGAVLSDQGPEVAIIQVFEVQERLSRARVVSGDAAGISVGSTCREVPVPPAPGG